MFLTQTRNKLSNITRQSRLMGFRRDSAFFSSMQLSYFQRRLVNMCIKFTAMQKVLITQVHKIPEGTPLSKINGSYEMALISSSLFV